MNLVTLGGELTTVGSNSHLKLLTNSYPNRELTPAPGSRRGGVQLCEAGVWNSARALGCNADRTPASTVSSVRPGGTARGDALTLVASGAPRARGPLVSLGTRCAGSSLWVSSFSGLETWRLELDSSSPGVSGGGRRPSARDSWRARVEACGT